MKLNVNIAGVELKNPIMTASGTFGSGKDFEPYVDINKIGCVVVKGIANKEWLGNPPPRIVETYGGMINAVGLQNPGMEVFCKDDIPFLRQFDTKIAVNISGRTINEYVEVAERLGSEDVDFLELNISCPNVKEGGVAFGVDPTMAMKVTKEVKKVARQPLIVKLSPNVTDITIIAKAVEDGGADALSLINTLIGSRIDIHRQKFILSTKHGGLSGPAVKPIAIRMVYQVSNAVDLPIIGMGGIMTGEDAIEFMMAGANAVAVGTANLLTPTATMNILSEMKAFLGDKKIDDVNDIVGIVTS
jgi:dihydroorotate dehydrogenase (NAD+) catalytic subunit